MTAHRGTHALLLLSGARVMPPYIPCQVVAHKDMAGHEAGHECDAVQASSASRTDLNSHCLGDCNGVLGHPPCCAVKYPLPVMCNTHMYTTTPATHMAVSFESIGLTDCGTDHAALTPNRTYNTAIC